MRPTMRPTMQRWLRCLPMQCCLTRVTRDARPRKDHRELRRGEIQGDRRLGLNAMEKALTWRMSGGGSSMFPKTSLEDKFQPRTRLTAHICRDCNVDFVLAAGQRDW